MSHKLILENENLRSQLHGAASRIAQMRNMIAGALCCHCGEPLGDNDENIISNDEDETIHKNCIESIMNIDNDRAH